MLMDGRVVALPEAERVAMRTAVAAKRAASEAAPATRRAGPRKPGARRLARRTADAHSQSPRQSRGMPSVKSEPELLSSLGAPEGSLTAPRQPRRSRCLAPASALQSHTVQSCMALIALLDRALAFSASLATRPQCMHAIDLSQKGCISAARAHMLEIGVTNAWC